MVENSNLSDKIISSLSCLQSLTITHCDFFDGSSLIWLPNLKKLKATGAGILDRNLMPVVG